MTPETMGQQHERYRRERDEARAEVREWEDWSNELAMLLPEDAETWPGANPEGAQESIITACLEHLLAVRQGLRDLVAATTAAGPPAGGTNVAALLDDLRAVLGEDDGS